MISFLYYLYERRLLREIRERPVPRHLGLILDGNRRYALERGFVDPLEAYVLGARKLDDMLLWCDELSIPAVSLWVLSTENFRRDASEVSGILETVEAKLVQLARHPRTHRLGVRVRAVGKLDLLPDSVVAAIREAEEATAANRGMVLTIAVAYGGRQEIIDAMQAMLREKTKQGEAPLRGDQAAEWPPSRKMVCPVMKSEAGEARKTASGPISSGRPIRRIGMSRVSRSLIRGSANASSVMGVANQPGAIAFTWIP